MDEYKGNSFASRKITTNDVPENNKKNIEPVTKKVTVKKQSELNKFGKKLFSEDARSVKGHVVNNVVIPNIQKLIVDSIKNAIDWLVYGTKSAPSDHNGVRNVSYSSYYDRAHNDARPAPSRHATPLEIDTIIFDERGEAEETLLRMRELIQQYGMASVADFYDFVDQPHEFTANDYGWRDLNNAEVVRKAGGFCIQFPKIIVL